jgi:hypothetical protein
MGPTRPPRTAPLLECGVCCQPYSVVGYLAAHQPGAVVCPHCGAHYHTFETVDAKESHQLRTYRSRILLAGQYYAEDCPPTRRRLDFQGGIE